VAIRFRRSPSVWRELVVASLPLGVALALNEIYFRADTFIISLSRSFDEVGFYALAFRIVEFGSVFGTILLTSMFPLLARYVSEEEARARRAIQAASDVFLAIAVPAAVGGFFLAPGIVEAAGGSDFEGATGPLRILIVSGALALVNGLFGYALIAKDKQLNALWLNVLALALNLGLNVALVPAYGIEAAAAVAVASEVVILAGSVVLMRRYFAFFPRVTVLGKVMLAAAAMGLALAPLRAEPLWLLAPLSVVAYGAALAVVGGFDRAGLREWRTRA
jgi:O-antigen/teichoic acid export membrane protein